MLYVYKVMNNLVPSFFVNIFTVNSAIHNYNTRQKNNLHIPSCHTKVREQRERLLCKHVERHP